MSVELTSLLKISRMVCALLLSQTRTDRILTNSLGTCFSRHICNTVLCYIISFIPHLFHRFYALKNNIITSHFENYQYYYFSFESVYKNCTKAEQICIPKCHVGTRTENTEISGSPLRVRYLANSSIFTSAHVRV